jgi:hypothetical protein
MLEQLFTIGITYMISLGIGLLINVMFQNHHNHQIERLT